MLVYCHNSTLISEADLGTESAIPDQCLTNVWHWLDISSVGLMSVGGFLVNDESLQLGSKHNYPARRDLKKKKMIQLINQRFKKTQAQSLVTLKPCCLTDVLSAYIPLSIKTGK